MPGTPSTRTRVLLLLAFAAGLAACDVLAPPTDPGDDPVDEPDPAPSVRERMPGLWRYPAFSWDQDEEVFLQIDSDLTAREWQHYAGAGCWEARQTQTRYRALTDSTFARELLYAGGAGDADTVRVRATEAQIRFEQTYLRNGVPQTFFSELQRSAEPAGTPCAFQLMGGFNATRAAGAALPRTYTATDSLGRAQTYRLTEASVFLYFHGAFLTVKQAVVSGGTTGPVLTRYASAPYVAAAGGAWTADLTATPSMPGLRLSGTPTPGGLAVQFQRAGMAAPLALTFSRTGSYAQAPGALDALRPRPDPLVL